VETTTLYLSIYLSIVVVVVVVVVAVAGVVVVVAVAGVVVVVIARQSGDNYTISVATMTTCRARLCCHFSFFVFLRRWLSRVAH
jgi:hypothetical protein